MPITKELKNVRTFESVGFSHEQAKALAAVIEESHTDSQENLKDFIRNEIKCLHNELKADIADSSKDLLIQIIRHNSRYRRHGRYHTEIILTIAFRLTIVLNLQTRAF